MADTANYNLIKPTVGGSENAWGGNLNDNFDKIDALLGGDQPVNGIDIKSGSVDGSLISGDIGGGDNAVSINADTEISGKVKKLTGMDNPNGKIENVSIDARDITIDGKVVEGNASAVTSTSPTFSPDNGSIAVGIINQSTTYNYNIAMPEAGQSLTLILNKSTSDNTNIVWKHNGNANVALWVGGGEPALNVGVNIIQFFSANYDGTGPKLFGAYVGVAS